MNGTALGIFGNLSNHLRVISHFTRIQNFSYRQYIVWTPRLNYFVDAIIVTSKQSFGTNLFDVALKISLWGRKEYLLNQFFTRSIGIQAKIHLGSFFMRERHLLYAKQEMLKIKFRTMM